MNTIIQCFYQQVDVVAPPVFNIRNAAAIVLEGLGIADLLAIKFVRVKNNRPYVRRRYYSYPPRSISPLQYNPAPRVCPG